eukprot:INCI4112.8.p3 GENE.INCI4112.8~~INCI4112.8.p3  ORF type:complete len:124 (+),score=4.32 INCI4112.8:692-1063(+)
MQRGVQHCIHTLYRSRINDLQCNGLSSKGVELSPMLLTPDLITGSTTPIRSCGSKKTPGIHTDHLDFNKERKEASNCPVVQQERSPSDMKGRSRVGECMHLFVGAQNFLFQKKSKRCTHCTYA